MNQTGRETSEARWERRYAEVETFIRLVGHARISKADAVHRTLRYWLKTQHALAAAGTLTVERWWRLRELGIELQGLDERWERRFDQLREFRRRFGHCRVPARWKEDVPFGHWVHVQKAFKKKGALSAMRIALLDGLGFEWHEPRFAGGREACWERRYGHLEQYRQEHGNTEVPASFREMEGLGPWVSNQRRAAAEGVLRPDRRARLEAVGFVWRAKGCGFERRWERRFAQLLKFQKRFGHCRVPHLWKEDLPFGGWVHGQRAAKKAGTLSPERIRRLEEAGFEWHGKSGPSCLSDHRWVQMLAHLMDYQKQHGDTQVSPSFRPHGLGSWVGNQREAWRKGTLRPDRREQLEAMGFDWRGVRKADAQRWERRFAQLAAYRQQHGHCRVPARWREDPAFGHWVDNQRAFKKAGKLSSERIRRLEEIGFNWRGSERIRCG